MTPANILRKAKERIATPERWCRLVCARNAHGDSVDPPGPDACMWCAAGATMTVELMGGTAVDYLHQQAEMLGYQSIGKYNDDPSTTHADIMALFDRAIAAADSGHGNAPS